MRRKFNPRLQVSGILITMANMRTAYSRDIVALLRESYGDKLRIFLHDPSGKVSAAYNAFTEEVAS